MMPAETATPRRRRGRNNGGEAGAVAAPDTAAARGTAQNGADAQPARPSPRDALRQLLMRSILMYGLYHYYWKKPAPDSAAQVIERGESGIVKPSSPASSLATLIGAGTANNPAYYSYKLQPAWKMRTIVEYRVFVNLESEMRFREARASGREKAVFGAGDVSFDTVPQSFAAKNVTLAVPDSVRVGNGTWYAHVFVTKGNMWGKSIEDLSESTIERSVLYTRHEIIKWIKVDLKKEGKSLLGGDDKDEKEDSAEANDESDSSTKNKDDSLGESEMSESESAATVRYDQVWKPTLPVLLVLGKGELILQQLPPTASAAYRVDNNTREYYPPMHVNEFWMVRESLQLMNDTVKEATLEMSFTPIGLYKWAMYKQFDNVWDKQISFGAMAPEDADELKRMFLETNPMLLGTTMVVSLAHTVLETLAFKNDIAHWKNIKTMEGVSVRSMIWKIVMEAIVFLYLWDNDTSWMITIGNGFGVALGIWKLGKAVKFENVGKRKLFGFIPWFDMVDRESYSKETKEYDEQAMKYLGYALYPLVAFYSMYTLNYEKHKSWYSWMVSSLVGAVYAFGFIMMFPQIFINYKLKSVAHMPMKAMMYKTLNTVIDDLFSFIIKMPWLHRLACFRDDIVFLILLYQRWIYPVDKKRVNEFGQQFVEGEQVETPAAVTAALEDAAESVATRADSLPEGAVKGIEEKKKD